MHRLIRGLAFAALASGTLWTTAPVLAADAAAVPAHYSVTETLVGKMLDDPTANALLKKLIPTVYNNEMFHTMGRDSTLKAIQQFEPEALSDEVLAKVQAELDKIPARS